MNTVAKKLFFEDLGLISYQNAWDYQEKIFADIIAEKMALRRDDRAGVYPENRLIFCEHPPVYTLGKSGDISHLLYTEEELNARGIAYHHINRGGDITFHGPGQLVGYPILDLDQFFTDIHQYLRYLEEAVIKTLAFFGVKGGRIKGLTGVWIDPDKPDKARKICAMGIKCSHWVTMHGFAFNINPDLHYFDHIIPCGIDDKGVTSLEKELGYKPDMAEVSVMLRERLTALFEWHLVEKVSCKKQVLQERSRQ